jgi:hypothetical protein
MRHSFANQIPTRGGGSVHVPEIMPMCLNGSQWDCSGRTRSRWAVTAASEMNLDFEGEVATEYSGHIGKCNEEMSYS